MGSIRDYSDLIKQIPANRQSTIIRRAVWERFSYDEKIKNAIFGNQETVEISRADVHSECDTTKKIIMVLMWGYPNGGRGNNITNIFLNIEELSSLLSSVNGKNLTKEEASIYIEKFKGFHGLGISTWSKLLYFFNVSVDSKRCQIFDSKIVDSLNKKQFSELGSQMWKQDNYQYYQYIELLNNLAECMHVLPEQVELFLFYYNLYYKFVS